MSEYSRTSLTQFAASMRDPDPAEARRKAREAYLESQGQYVLINKSWLRNWPERKQLDQLAVVALGVKGDGK